MAVSGETDAACILNAPKVQIKALRHGWVISRIERVKSERILHRALFKATGQNAPIALLLRQLEKKEQPNQAEYSLLQMKERALSHISFPVSET